MTLHDVTFLDGWTVADFNNDGNPDVLLAQGYPTTVISVFLGNGQGGFKTPGPHDIGAAAADDSRGADER